MNFLSSLYNLIHHRAAFVQHHEDKFKTFFGAPEQTDSLSLNILLYFTTHKTTMNLLNTYVWINQYVEKRFYNFHP